MKNIPNKIYLQMGLEKEDSVEDFNTLERDFVTWENNQIYNDDLQFISVDFIKSFLDPYCFNNKNVWEDDEYLKECYPTQYLIKNLLK